MPQHRHRREDYWVVASIETSKGRVDNLPCKVFLPHSASERPRLVFLPNAQHAVHRIDPYMYSFRAELKNHKQEVVGLIEAVEVHTRSIPVLDQDESGMGHQPFFVGRPTRLKVTEWGDSPRPIVKQGQFYLTTGTLLDSLAVRKPGLDAAFLPAPEAQTLVLSDGTRLNFVYYGKSLDPKGKVRSEQLRARFETLSEQMDVENLEGSNLLHEVEDILQLVALGIRSRSAVTGWSTSDGIRTVRVFRGNIIVPRPTSDKSAQFDAGLVATFDFWDYLHTVCGAFAQETAKAEIRGLLNKLCPVKRPFVEDEFVGIFSCLEFLVRRKAGLDSLLPSERWKALRSDIAEAVSRNAPPELRSRIIERISELVRPSPSDFWARFCQENTLEVDDLWPLTKGSASLSWIRNRLAHGVRFQDSQYFPFFGALFHLRWLAERTLLCLLKWPIDKSAVSGPRLKSREVFYHEWKGYRDKLKAARD